MATVLESVIIPRHSSSKPTPVMVSSLAPLAQTVKIQSLPQFNGLRTHFQYSKCTFVSKNARIVRRGGRVVCEAQDTALDVPSVTDKTWESLVLKADVPVLVEFWAPWCGPCRMILPVIAELSKQYAGKLNCYKLNTDESPLTATQYGIRSIPTVMIFKDGVKKDAVIGAVPRATLVSSIDKFV
ncbi:hypothetical protein IFM89_011377 [Coptis chinensis]|uniref:Thioredoxin domain-containing protein n=1 Tax=Coptis chinensis TaxID=261450 RepID=A0A835HJB3_9MAGN|nr:hypothetical protein IFM89_011377 [Coptis chinensis]